MAATADGRVYIACSGVDKVGVVEPDHRKPLPGSTASCDGEDMMNATAAKPQEQRCQAVSHVDEPCSQNGQQYCKLCRQWFCRAHFPDPDWHACAPEQGES